MNDLKRATNSPPMLAAKPAPYGGFVLTAAAHTASMMPKRRMSYLAAILAFSPLLIPAALLAPRDIFFEVNGQDVFVQLTQFIYINALCPLLALFFGCMLIGEDIEANTFPYILTRPIPRSAWVTGKFLGYLAGVSVLVGASMTASYLLSTRLSHFPVSGEGLLLLAKYLGVTVLALGAYGAVSLLLGAVLKRPMIVGIVLFFFWQKIALVLPGYIDFFTIDKYVSAIMPKIEGMPGLLELAAQLLGAGKLIVPANPVAAGFTLMGIMIAGVALASYAAREREYSAAQSAGH